MPAKPVHIFIDIEIYRKMKGVYKLPTDKPIDSIPSPGVPQSSASSEPRLLNMDILFIEIFIFLLVAKAVLIGKPTGD